MCVGERKCERVCESVCKIERESERMCVKEREKVVEFLRKYVVMC